jgi:Mrp family chromosome partitioning ATPase
MSKTCYSRLAMPFLGTIPQVDQTKNYLTVLILVLLCRSDPFIFSNIYLPTKDGLGHVILFTSSIKERKSFSAFHNALTMSSLNKKVCLLDRFKKPQLHDYFKVRKALWDFLIFSLIKNLDWKSFLKTTLTILKI